MKHMDLLHKEMLKRLSRGATIQVLSPSIVEMNMKSLVDDGIIPPFLAIYTHNEMVELFAYCCEIGKIDICDFVVKKHYNRFLQISKKKLKEIYNDDPKNFEALYQQYADQKEHYETKYGSIADADFPPM